MAGINRSLIVIGGRTEELTTLSSSEMLSGEDNSWVAGPDLGWPLEQSCGVTLNTSHVILVGGMTSITPIVRHDSAYIVNVVTGDVWRTAAMIHGGRSGHGCAGLPGDQDRVERVVVVGGDTYPGDVSRMVELYTLATNSWSELAPLPWSVTGAPGVIWSNGHILVMGGYSDQGISSRIAMWRHDTNWTDTGVKMKDPRAIFPLVPLSQI